MQKENRKDVVKQRCHSKPRPILLGRAPQGCNAGSISSTQIVSQRQQPRQAWKTLKQVQGDNTNFTSGVHLTYNGVGFTPSLVIPQCRYAGYSEGTSGFTLIELLVVVLIIGILAAVALPQYQKVVEKSRAAQGLTLIKSVAQAARAHHLASGEFAQTFDELDLDIAWTGNTKISSNASDARSNADWSIQLYNDNALNQNEIYATRLSGPYAGAGFILTLTDSSSQWKSDTVYCAEWKSSDVMLPFGKPEGDYCVKLMKGTVIFRAGIVNIFSLP